MYVSETETHIERDPLTRTPMCQHVSVNISKSLTMSVLQTSVCGSWGCQARHGAAGQSLVWRTIPGESCQY